MDTNDHYLGIVDDWDEAPDRVLRLAQQVRDDYVPSDDPAVLRLVRLMGAYDICSPMEHRWLKRAYPGLYEAYRLYMRGRSDRRNLDIVAGILAGVPAEELAKLTGLNTAAIAEYKECFFDIDREGGSSVIRNAIDHYRADQYGPPGQSPQRILMLLAYQHGWESYLEASGVKLATAETIQHLTDFYRLNEALKLVSASQTEVVDAETAPKILQRGRVEVFAGSSENDDASTQEYRKTQEQLQRLFKLQPQVDDNPDEPPSAHEPCNIPEDPRDPYLHEDTGRPEED